ncbi:MAG: RNA methyltransferase [Ignavibacteria bacterium]|nr:RNA methyltransferase [Ignavibacteria bacterium]
MLSANQLKLFASLKNKKYRHQHKLFLIEGFHLIDECLKSNFELEYIILRNDIDLQGHTSILKKISNNKTIVEPLPEKQFNLLSETESSQGIIGVVKIPVVKSPKAEGKIILALDRINDPGNLGTIIRTAWWFGIKDILLSDDCADIYNPKVIRATQGGIFNINFAENCDLLTELQSLYSHGYKIFLFTLNCDKKLSQLKDTGKSVLVFGSEAHGINENILNAGFQNVKIEGYSNAESLNVAVSSAIAMYQFTR